MSSPGVGSAGRSRDRQDATGTTESPAPQDAGAGPVVSTGGQASTQNPAAAGAVVSPDGRASTQNVTLAEAAVTAEEPAASATPAGATSASAAPAAGRGDAAAQQVMLVLQRSLLPATLPVYPQVRLAARHLVAAEDPGGGCFDAFALATGRIVLMAGQAAGHGPGAAAALSELRAVLRAALRDGADLAAALAQADAFAAASPGGRGATAALGLLDPATGSLSYASAGHPVPPAWVGADLDPASDSASAGLVSFLAPAGGGPLGTGAGPPAVTSAVLPPGAVLLLCSAGRGQGPTPDGGDGRDGPAAGRFMAAVSSAVAGGDWRRADAAERMCGAVAGRLAGGKADGDVTVLAAHHLPEPQHGLSMRLPSDPVALRRLRARLAAWLAEVGASPLDRVDTELAVYEAAANAIVHGQPPQGTATVTVEIGLDGTGGVLIKVCDRGRWRPRSPGAAERPGGRGLSVISQVAGELSITPSPDGTTVLMRRALGHPVTVDRAPAR